MKVFVDVHICLAMYFHAADRFRYLIMIYSMVDIGVRIRVEVPVLHIIEYMRAGNK